MNIKEILLDHPNSSVKAKVRKVHNPDLSVLHAAYNQARTLTYIDFDRFDDYDDPTPEVEPRYNDPAFVVLRSDLSCSEAEYLNLLTDRFAQLQKINLRWFYHRDDSYLLFIFNLNP